ncbi:hypothetical protein [Roseibaca sp. Y0-43]|uniref:hypothetical protein n=1 Tax=Roseibaca sp. Y0-43 TaxID=2816854 RepID=UPI001D0C638F|nr:hypothetical protein [Roseibaca sp. Y0-43]MCC1481003.1 hypothetical protein [Roseibaca sp. Y0-43]
MTRTTSDDDLDLFFAAGQDSDLPDALRARILADAASALPKPAPGWGARIKAWTAGWAMPSVAGGLGAALAGVYIGMVMPLSLYDVPVWMDGALSVFDQVTTPLLGVGDPLEMGF